MSGETYEPAGSARRIAEGDVVIPTASAIPALTCRWTPGVTPKAVVVFCHGLGSSGRDYATLSQVWAAQGYLVVHPTFPDWIGAVAASEPALGLDPTSDLTGWVAQPAVRARMFEILHTPAAWMERIRIVRAVLDAVPTILEKTSGRSDRAVPIAIAGHSFGAYTAQLLAGAVIDMPGGVGRFHDPRLVASVLLSAQGRDQQGLRDGSWDGMTGPVLTVTGTLDRGAKGQDWIWKREPYLLAPAGGKYFMLLHGAGHDLGGVARPSAEPGAEAHRDALARVTTAFLDAHAAHDRRAQAWLLEPGDQLEGDIASLEHR